MLTVVATLVAAVPGFLTLFREKAEVYYYYNRFSVLNPDTPDYQRVTEVLQKNFIPDSRIVLHVFNNGDAPAHLVKVRLKVDGIINNAATSPAAAEKPVWVLLPDNLGVDEKTKSIVTFELKDLAPQKGIRVDIGYNTSPDNDREVDVYDEKLKPATFVQNRDEIPKRSLSEYFKWPLAIFLPGLIAFLILRSAKLVIAQDAKQWSAARQFIKEVMKRTLGIGSRKQKLTSG